MIQMPTMGDESTKAWKTLLELSDRLPEGWTLVGGQMVHLLCAEHGAAPSRPTDDLDTTVNVRAYQRMLLRFTTELHEIGFSAETPPSADGHQHRWWKDTVQIDVVQPRGIGARLRTLTGFSGSTTIESPGMQQALDRTERVDVRLADGTTGKVNRPNLLGTLVVKSAALTTNESDKTRHLIDLTVLATLITTQQMFTSTKKRDESYLRGALTALSDNPQAVAQVGNGQDAVDRLRQYVENRRRRRELSGNSHPTQPPQTNPWDTPKSKETTVG